MCGLAGWVDGSPAASDILRRMCDAIAHRGPDADGFHVDGEAALGHRRLAVIDLEASRQPMRSEDGRHALAYNGELYNFRELRAELESRGRRFRTAGDTEVVLQSLAEWGGEAVRRFRGMFALAFWDARERTMLLARDPLGVKPLHYAWDGRRLLFASEIKALLAHPSVDRTLDLDALRLYLECQFIPAPHTAYRAIRKLPQAHTLLLRDGRIALERYWRPSSLPRVALDEREAEEALDRELRASVESMLVADVPLGAFVSGGIDSSLVAAVMQSMRSSPIDVFNVGFTDPGAQSEHAHARRVADHIGASMHALMLSTDDVPQVLEPCIDLFDEPFGDQAALPTFLLSGLARRHVTVALTGEGADEVLAGYGNYARALRQQAAVARLGAAWSPWRSIYPWLPAALRKERLLKAASRPANRRYVTIPSVLDAETHAAVLTPAMLHATDGRRWNALESFAAAHHDACDSPDYLDRMLHVDTNLWLPDDLLTKVDRTTMAHSLEARVPYLDHRFVEFAARLPPHLKIGALGGKHLLKRVALRYLPPEIVLRPKQGFMLPLQHWLSHGLRAATERALSPQGLARRNIVRPAVLERLRREQFGGRPRHSIRTWALLCLELWLERRHPEFAL
jgi:asparagine synthase (glutamine-hydrolysing)